MGQAAGNNSIFYHDLYWSVTVDMMGFARSYSKLSQAAGNNSLTDGIEYSTWRNVYHGHRAILPFYR